MAATSAPTSHPTVPRIACLMVPDFTIAALYRVEPDLREIPLAITDGTGPRATITAVSVAAARLEVRAGITASQGTAICPSLVLRTPWGATPRTTTSGDDHGGSRPSAPPPPHTGARPAGIDYRRTAQAALCEVAASCSPRIEDASAGNEQSYGMVYLDALGAPFPSENALGAALTARAARVGLDVRVGVASTKMTARIAAMTSAGVAVVPPDTESRFLAPLPLARLNPAPELAATLSRWGITRLGELACLSPAAAGMRLGPAGATLVRRARGEDTAPLVPTSIRPAFEEEVSLDYDIDMLEPLTFVLRGCIDRLTARLSTCALACGKLRLSLGLVARTSDERAIAVAAPTTDMKVLLTLTRLNLEAAPPQAPVKTIRITAVPEHIRATQLDLFRPAGPAPQHLATTLARLTAICGPGRVGAPAVVDSHRPEALALAPFDPPHGSRNTHGNDNKTKGPPRRSTRLPPVPSSAAPVAPPASPGTCPLALRAVRPPRHIEIFADRGVPDFACGHGLGGRVVALAGPWRITGEWWTAERFARDYYDIGLSDGGVYRIYHDLRSAEWLLEAEYD